MNRNPFKVALAAVIVLAGALALFGMLGTAARAIVALPLVLVAPGYAITAAAFPRRGLDGATTLLFSLGLSLTIAIVGGLVLNLTPWGLETGSWVVFLSLTILGGGAIAVRRRPGLSVVPAGAGRSVARSAYPVAPLMAAALVLIVATRVAATGELRQQHKGFTQLSILSIQGSAARVSITNQESATTSYRLQLTAGGRTIRQWPSLTLAQGDTWQATVALPSTPSRAGRVQATLYRTVFPRSVYRRAWLWRDR